MQQRASGASGIWGVCVFAVRSLKFTVQHTVALQVVRGYTIALHRRTRAFMYVQWNAISPYAVNMLHAVHGLIALLKRRITAVSVSVPVLTPTATTTSVPT